jgi:phage tail-like protein
MSAALALMTAETLSPVQRSALHVGPQNGLPHDPLAFVLYARAGIDPLVGFAAAALDVVVVARCPAALMLGPPPGMDRSLVEPSGSFGGLRPPTNVAVSGDGTVYLVDRSHALVKYFDVCECAFRPLPCFGPNAADSPPSAPHGFVPLTLLADPAGLAIAGVSLLVADRGHHRVVVVALVGQVPRGALRLPSATGLRRLWSPFAVAVDREGRVYVSDPERARVDLFGADGRWRRAWVGLGYVSHLAVDCDDRLLAVIEDFDHDATGKPVPAAVELVDGVPRRLAGGPDTLRRRLPRNPLGVDRVGRLDLGLCAGGRAVFDLQGYPVRDEDKTATQVYAATGTYRSGALDSRRRGCVWHRVVLAAALPKRTSIRIATTTSDVELDATELADLPAEAWAESVPIGDLKGGIGDALVQSPPGRYLWLRLALTGDGAASPRVDRIVVEFPRVSLRRYLPSVFGMDPAGADFTDRFIALFDTTLRSIENRIDTLYELFDPATAPAERAGKRADFLSWLATWIGVSLPRPWPEAVRRTMLTAATRTLTRRGTRAGLWSLLVSFLGFDRGASADSCVASRCAPRPRNCAPDPPPCAAPLPPLILEHFKLRRWLFVGAGRLGDESILWGRRIVNRSELSGATRTGNARLGPLDCPPDREPATQLVSTPDPLRDPFLVYAHKFTVFVPARVRSRDWQRRGLELLLAREAPAHTAWDIAYVEPRFRVGVQALIGLDSVIARVPHGIRLNDNRLGRGTVLPPQPGRAALVGITARVGETTRLT